MEPHSVFNNLDYIVIGVVFLSAFLAMMRGFVRELFSLVAWVGAYFIGTKFYEPVIPWVHHFIKNDRVAEVAAMAFVFVVTLIVLSILGHLICGFIRGRALTAIDRSLGFLYGLLRGALVVSLIYLGAVMILWPDIDAPASEQQKDNDRNRPPDFLLEAKTRPALAFGAKELMVFVPKDMIDKELKDVEAQKKEAEKAARQKALDSLSPPDVQDEEKKGPIDIDKLFKQDDSQ
jgi:membrane protein required for colicin V production